jgi:hypothetical protein
MPAAVSPTSANGNAHPVRFGSEFPRHTSPRPSSRSVRTGPCCRLHALQFRSDQTTFQRPDERYTAGLFAEYEISRALQPYMEFMFMDDRTVAQIAPSGDFGNNVQPQLRQSAPLGAAAFDHLRHRESAQQSQRDVVGAVGRYAVDFVDPINRRDL